MVEKPRIIILGSGKMARFLLNGFTSSGIEVVQLYGRTAANVIPLAEEFGVNHTLDIQSIDTEGDLYILAVSDDAISILSEALSKVKGIVVHTSGAASIQNIHAKHSSGVFYPLQTLAGDKQADIKETPILIEGDTDATTYFLLEFATSVSRKVLSLSSEKRLEIHLAAVMVNNFTNHLYELAEDFLEGKDISFELLKPLMQRTLDLTFLHPGRSRQTGPAHRGDLLTIEKHFALIKHNDALREIYEMMTRSIRASAKK